jgi:hypothetical protein
MIVQNYLFSGARQSMGGTTFQKWKGIQTARTKPTNVENPRSPAQQLNRGKLALLAILARVFRQIILVGMRDAAQKMTEYNAFVKYNIATAIDGTTAETLTLDYENLVVARGTEPSPIINGYDIAGQEVQIDIQSPNNVNIPDGSIAYACVYNPTLEIFDYGSVTFDGGTATGSFPTLLANTSGAKFYVFYVNSVTGKVSDSVMSGGAV